MLFILLSTSVCEYILRFKRAWLLNKRIKKKIRLCLVTVFVFYYQKPVFGNTNKKTIFLYFWNQKHVWLVEIKKDGFLRKKNRKY